MILFAAAVSACTGSGSVRYSARADVRTPALVEVEPGVQVIADYDEPVFYSDGLYWRYYGGVWYRSPYYDRAWVQVRTVPVAVRRIDHPEWYVHYRAGVRVGPDRREQANEIREERQEARDHREELRDEQQRRHDAKEIAHDRAEIRQDQRELARDRKEIERDDARDDRRELARDRRELKRDQRETGRDKQELRDDRRRQARKRR